MVGCRCFHIALRGGRCLRKDTWSKNQTSILKILLYIMQVKKTKDDGKINRINFVNPCPTRLRT